MSAAAPIGGGGEVDLLTYARVAQKLHEAKDKTYQLFPLGREWAEFLRAKKLAGCRPNTLESYESVGDKLARFYPYMVSSQELADEPERILHFLEETWPDVDPDTLQQRFAVMGSFFEWAYRTDRVTRDPMGKIERPKRRRKAAARPRIPEQQLNLLVSGQESLRDQAALLLLGRLGLRREDLRLLQLRDIDLGTDAVQLRHSKGGREFVLPIAFRAVRDTLYLHLQERGSEHVDEYLVYPKAGRTRPLSSSGIDLWFKRCMSLAGLVGYTMHQLRHAAIDEVRRQTRDVELARQLARHANVSTTQTYLHSELEDLRLALEEMEQVGT